jgi:hypothetical protein
MAANCGCDEYHLRKDGSVNRDWNEQGTATSRLPKLTSLRFNGLAMKARTQLPGLLVELDGQTWVGAVWADNVLPVASFNDDVS